MMSVDGDAVNPELGTLLEALRNSRGFEPREALRVRLAGVVARRPRAAEGLESRPEEIDALLDALLSPPGGFGRDPADWDALRDRIIPAVLARKGPDAPLRVWCAGRGAGVEAYMVAMILAELLGIDAFRARVKIYATERDPGALARARRAVFSLEEIAAVPQPLRDKYFDEVPALTFPVVSPSRSFHKELRRLVIFGRHDLLENAPIARIDLLVCRDTLVYFDLPTQARILARFRFALNDGAPLMLGAAETLPVGTVGFEALDAERRGFVKSALGPSREPAPKAARPATEGAGYLFPRLREAAFLAGPMAQVVVDFGGQVVLANEPALTLFHLNVADLGRPLQDLQLSYRPADLRTLIDRVYKERRAVHLAEVEWAPGDGPSAYLDIHVTPLLGASGPPLGASVTFHDVTVARRLKDELQTAHQALETAHEELQSTNEELETTNEELQSTVEELETTNEELQSTNEELETLNEELQSTNEEMEAINGELSQRGEELNHLNAFLEAILASLRGGVVVVDRDLTIQLWNPRAEDLWGLRGGEVYGKNLLNLDIGLPTLELRPLIRACLTDESAPRSVTLSATNRRGKAIRCRVTCTPISTGAIEGVILVMDELEPTE